MNSCPKKIRWDTKQHEQRLMPVRCTLITQPPAWWQQLILCVEYMFIVWFLRHGFLISRRSRSWCWHGPYFFGPFKQDLELPSRINGLVTKPHCAAIMNNWLSQTAVSTSRALRPLRKKTHRHQLIPQHSSLSESIGTESQCEFLNTCMFSTSFPSVKTGRGVCREDHFFCFFPSMFSNRLGPWHHISTSSISHFPMCPLLD